MARACYTLPMKLYSVRIAGDKWDTNFTVKASSWATAVSRAIREWGKQNKGSRTTQLTIKAMKSSDLLVEKGE